MPEDFIDSRAKLLHQLLTERTVPGSKVKSKAAKFLFDRLQQTEIIKKQRKGAGSQYQVMHLDALQAFIEQEYPNGLLAMTMTDLPSRIQGVLQSQDSKIQKKLDFVLLTVRGGTTIKHEGKTHDLNMLTNAETSLCLKISPSSLCELPASPCTIVTVENPTAYVELEKMLEHPWQLAIYTAGKMSNILLQQLQYWYQQQHQLLHFGDYDYVGLLEFARILICCPESRSYYPENLPMLLQKNGNAQLLEKQTEQHKSLLRTLEYLPSGAGKNDLNEVYRMLQSSAKGLEQEGLYNTDHCRELNS